MVHDQTHEFISIGTIFVRGFATILHSESSYREVEIREEMVIISDAALDLSAFYANLELGNYLLLNPGYFVAIRTTENHKYRYNLDVYNAVTFVMF